MLFAGDGGEFFNYGILHNLNFISFKNLNNLMAKHHICGINVCVMILH